MENSYLSPCDSPLKEVFRKMSPKPWDAIVIGAGIIGLATAMENFPELQGSILGLF